MQAVVQQRRLCAAMMLLASLACQPPSASIVSDADADATETGVQPASIQPSIEEPPGRDHITPGTYKFTAKVKSVRIMGLDTSDKIIHGVATIDGERCVFTGLDVNWAVALNVLEVEKPVWFLKAGNPVTIVVHSPTHVFRKPGEEVCGEVFDFSLKITRANDGELHFGPLTAVAG